jgi:twinkle protein
MNNFIDFGINIGNSKGSQVKTLCPKCSSQRKKKTDPCLSVNVNEGIWNCFNCGWNGSLKKKIYKLPEVKEIKSEYSAGLIKYFEDRKISEETLKFMKVSEGKTFMPTANKELNTIQFNYFRNDILINTKFRSGRKDFKMVKDAELIFYNLDSIKDELSCIITEGEIDCLSYIEAGILNVISVPNGASKGSNLEYINNCKEYFETKDKIYLAIDNDEAGNLLKSELVRRFGTDKCWIIKYPEDCKDTNDVLMKYGVDKVREIYYSAKSIPVNDVIYVEDVRDKLLEDFRNGLSKGTTTYFESIDKHFTWLKGDLTLVSGIPSHGKSKIIKQLCLIKSVKEGTKWAIFSPEEYPPTYFFSDLAHTYLGQNVNKHYFNQCSEKDYLDALDFIQKHFFYIFPDSKRATPEFINNKFSELIMKEGIEGGIIDPFNQLDNNFAEFGRDDHYLSDFLSKEKQFALKHNFYKIIIAHPKGLKKNAKGFYDCPDAYDLSGGAMWNNKCDNILAIHRPTITDEYLSTQTEFHSQKIKKQSLVGIPGIAILDFNRVSNRYLENGRSPFNILQPIENYSQQQVF